MHRAFFFGFLMALGLTGASGQASSCSVDSIANIEGISGDNDNGIVCCPLECGQCGGGGCGQAGAGNTECCVNGVLENQRHCYDEPVAPCVIDRFDDVCNPDPCPENSVCNVGGYSTGYSGVDLQAFCWCVEGYENTNTYQSTSNNRPERGITCTLIDPCSTNPCGDNSLCEVQKLDVSPDTFTPAFAVCSCEEGFDNTGPSDEPGEIMCTNGDGPVCSNGVPGIEGENGNGKVCCPVGCNGCGGTGCGRIGAAAGLNNKDCCINGVLNNQPDCADADGTAPCVIETF